ncbi:homocysteine S-methyltransferase [Lactobacillus ultunensis]|uniref:Homocysteine S-methyltransferase n=1 Tax=Lactobacillus ultunensis DSM 16047 TaxID=525365 RepID=C2EMY5_9LACO|nr:homocysteine S-methyltransferase [Lactobacillus ultunensis]EEJ72113.1 homocysteine S-methyltransferase [Lactobacillus ultunensis DSM 16047]KRL80844.1 homocysteine methyltransferase [Lactobacillus ultunensis DSM 16047]
MNLINQISNKGLILDGAMSTALEKQGIDTNNDLWTAIALEKDLDKVHMDYFKAGAQMTITDTYQANVQAFKKHGYTEEQAEDMIAKAVEIAKQARDDYEKKTGIHNFVAASVGSYGAYLARGDEFRGDYKLTSKQYLNFHLPRLKVLLKNKPDCLAIETQPKLEEVVAILDWLKANSPQIPVYVSFTLHDTTKISDGTPLKQAMQKLNEYNQVFAVGANCFKPFLATAAIDKMKEFTKKAIIIYPNLGGVYDEFQRNWIPFNAKFDFRKLSQEWYEHGARIIGGCCSTGIKEVGQIATFYKTISSQKSKQKENLNLNNDLMKFRSSNI